MNWHLTVCIVLILSASRPTSAEAKTKNGQGDDWCFKDYATVGIVGGTVALAAAPFALTWMGFTAAGVAAGSVAASIQSAVYGGTVASSSAFAALQSAGAAGLGAKATVGVFSAGLGAAAWIKSWVAPCNEGPECSSEKH
ncbi:interferon alpha-inducible protein 27-like protein 2A [Orbicella faveolata]|uniref:interferon alpha-inducible protein 27-like protein 2A n=1 Tax=Orbicella faveolata TaxID=48498 RepID=UPI0009E18FD9|nr:interferon alpha-inducible protein 27-like protein 2A [Orbicella faveolata]